MSNDLSNDITKHGYPPLPPAHGSDTPRTDAAWAKYPYAGPGVSVHFARRLERELIHRAVNRDKHAARYAWSIHFRDANGLTWSLEGTCPEALLETALGYKPVAVTLHRGEVLRSNKHINET